MTGQKPVRTDIGQRPVRTANWTEVQSGLSVTDHSVRFTETWSVRFGFGYRFALEGSINRT